MGCVCCCGIPICCSVPPKWSAWIYYIGFLIVSIISWVLREYGGSALDFGPANGCTENGNCGDLAVLRLSFGSMLFFATMAILTLGVTEDDNPRAKIHTGFWPIKFLVWGALIASTFAMPNGTFEVYQYIARVFSAFFILLQLVILLDSVYKLNEYLLERDQCAFTLITLTVVMIAGTIVGMGFLYKYWAPNGGCSLNIFFITFTFILFLLYGAISVSPYRTESAGLMTSAAVFAYSMYYTWSALQSEPQVDDAGLPRECVPGGSGGTGAIQIISFILVMICLSLTTTNSGTSSSSFSLVQTQNDSTSGGDSNLNYRPDFFYLTFMLASSYVGMVLTGWGLNQQDQGEFGVDKGWGSVWAKMAASWLCAVLYTWSLIAHKILTSRTF